MNIEINRYYIKSNTYYILKGDFIYESYCYR